MIGWGFLLVLSLCFDRCAQDELRRAERTAARLIDDIGWSTPMAPARSAAASPGKPLPQRAPQHPVLPTVPHASLLSFQQSHHCWGGTGKFDDQ